MKSVGHAMLIKYSSFLYSLLQSYLNMQTTDCLLNTSYRQKKLTSVQKKLTRNSKNYII